MVEFVVEVEAGVAEAAAEVFGHTEVDGEDVDAKGLNREAFKHEIWWDGINFEWKWSMGGFNISNAVN